MCCYRMSRRHGGVTWTVTEKMQKYIYIGENKKRDLNSNSSDSGETGEGYRIQNVEHGKL